MVQQRAGGGEPGVIALGFEEALELGFDGGQVPAFIARLLKFVGEVTAAEPGVTVIPFEKQGVHVVKDASKCPAQGMSYLTKYLSFLYFLVKLDF